MTHDRFKFCCFCENNLNLRLSLKKTLISYIIISSFLEESACTVNTVKKKVKVKKLVLSIDNYTVWMSGFLILANLIKIVFVFHQFL